MALLLATLTRVAFDPILEDRSPYTTYFAAIMFSAWYSGLGPSILVVIFGGLLGNYFFDEPRYSLWISDLENGIQLGLYTVVGCVVTWLSALLQASRERVEAARHELEASEERFRTIADFTYDWEYWVGPDGRAIYVSPSCERITGQPASEFLSDSRRWISVAHPEDRAGVEEHLHLEHASAAPLMHEFRILTHGGAVRWIEHMCQAVYGRQGEYLGRRANNRDVTERKEAEAATRHAQARLLDEQQHATAEKVASVGRLAAAVAHEIRNPLTAIKMWLFSIRESVSKQPEVGRKLTIVSEEVARLEGIVREFLEFSRPPTLNCRPQPLAPLLAQLLEFLGPRLEQDGIRVRQDVPPDLPLILADSEQLKQVFLNLLGNAAEALPGGGELRILAAADHEAEGRHSVVIRVGDSGPGIPAELQERLFQPFFTTKEHGTGIGLWISAQIMARHQGQLVLESSTDRGTVFAIRIPVAEAATHGQDSGR